MTHQVELPALDGRDPLGFLAALGVLRLLRGTKLSFSRTTGIAQLHSGFATVEDVATVLRHVIESIADGAVIPAAPTHLPRPKNGSGPDPMRVTREEFPALAAEMTSSEAGRLWLGSLITDLAVDKKGRTAISPLMAPSGQQSIRSFFTNPLKACRANPDRIHEALTQWRREEDFTGEYLDHRVLNNAADHPSGKSTEAGVPGATWLAIMALPLLRVTSSGRNTVSATCWHTPAGRRTPVMIWPLWQQPMSPLAVQALLEHPALQPKSIQNKLHIDLKPLAELGVFHVAAAERQLVEGRKFAGALAPCSINAPLTSRPRSTPPTTPIIF